MSPAGRAPMRSVGQSGSDSGSGQRPGPRSFGTYFLGRYRVVDEIGVGGMASVHLARMDGPGGFQKWVAIKRIHPHLVEDDSFISSFLDEARIAARISHSNVAQVFDLGKDENTYWIAMEYLHGEPLREIMRRAEDGRPVIPTELAARIIADAAEGLHAAHELRDKDGALLNLVHRDVTPHNLFLTYDGNVKVVDFGIAKISGRQQSTRAGTLKGKIAYMSPEQVRGVEVDRRTDVFALGVVLWELTTGRRLFRMESDLETLERVQACMVPAPTALLAGYPPELERIVLKALSRRAEDRFQTAREFSRALQQFIVRRGALVGPEEIAAFVTDVFHDRVKKREEHLRWAAEVTQTIALDDLQGERKVPGGTGSTAEELSLVSYASESEVKGAQRLPPPRPAAGLPLDADAEATRALPARDRLASSEVPTSPPPAAGRRVAAAAAPPKPAHAPPPSSGQKPAPPAPARKPTMMGLGASPPAPTPPPPSARRQEPALPAFSSSYPPPARGLGEDDDDEDDIKTIVGRPAGGDGPPPAYLAPTPAAGAPALSVTPPVILALEVIAPPPVPPAYAPTMPAAVPGAFGSYGAAPMQPQPIAVPVAPQQAPPRPIGLLIALAVLATISVSAVIAIIVMRPKSGEPAPAASTTQAVAPPAAPAAAPVAPVAAATTAPVAPVATPAPTVGASPDSLPLADSPPAQPAAAPAPPAPAPPPKPVDVPASKPAPLPAPAAPAAAAAPAATKEKDAPPAGGPGFLTIVCNPFCEDVRDGARSLGPSPVVHVSVPPGEHRIALKRKGSPTKVISVIVVSGQVTSRREQME